MPKVGDRFNPHRIFTGVFIPDAIYTHPELSSTAKLLYGRLCKYKGERGEAYPAGTTLAEELGISERQVFDHLARLVLEGFIEREPRGGTSTVYHFLWHSCFDSKPTEVVRKTALPEKDNQCGKPHHGSAENRTGGSAENRIGSESSEESQLSESVNTLPSFPETEPKSQTFSESLDLISLHKTLCSKFKALRKSGGLQKPLRDLVAERVERVNGWSEPQVLDVFHVWCSTVGWEGFDGRHRINSFFSFLQSCDPSDFPVNATAEPAIESPTPSRCSGAADSAKGLETRNTDFPTRWNELVPESLVDPQLLPCLPKAYRDPIFTERFDEICAKARSLIREGADLKFGFLLKESGGRFRWQELLADELAWMKPKPTGKSNAGPDPAKAMIEDLLRRRKAKGYEAGTP